MKQRHLLIMLSLLVALVSCSPRITRQAPSSASVSLSSVSQPTHSPTVVRAANQQVQLASGNRSDEPRLENYGDHASYVQAFYAFYDNIAASQIFSNPSSVQLASSPTSLPSAPVTISPSQRTTTLNPVVTSQPEAVRVQPVATVPTSAVQVSAPSGSVPTVVQHAPSITIQTHGTQTRAATNNAAALASNSTPSGGPMAGDWQGNAVDSVRGTNTGTRLVIYQRGNRLGGQAYFETIDGLAYFGELQGALTGNDATITLRYEDGSYTYFTGRFEGSSFVGEYQYMTSAGTSVARGSLRLNRR